MKPLATGFISGITHVSTCKIDQVMKKEKIDPHPDTEWLFGCLIKSNRKCTTLLVFPSSLSITVIRAKVSKLQIKVACYDKENFTLRDIMRFS